MSCSKKMVGEGGGGGPPEGQKHLSVLLILQTQSLSTSVENGAIKSKQDNFGHSDIFLKN